MGLHDSELSIVMEDRNLLDSTMDGKPFQAGHHAATLRRFLWREHLGLLPAQNVDASNDPNAQPPDVCPNNIMDGTKEYEFVADPLSNQVWDMWTGNATRNTDLFRHLFRADPDDNSEFLLCAHHLWPISTICAHLSYPLCAFSSSSFFLLILPITTKTLSLTLPPHSQSKLSTTTPPSSPATQSTNKATSTTPSWTPSRSARSSIRSRAI